jgi:anti-anti-sigma factor
MAHSVLPMSARTVAGVSSDFTVRIVRAEGMRTVVVLGGEADFSIRPDLSDALARLIAMGTGDVVIDLAELEFIDTAIVRALAMGQRLLGRRGRRLTFRSPSRLAARVLDSFGLTDLIEAGAVALP